MISHTLQTLTVATVGDDTKTEAKIDRGVTQGGPASPTLFNIFIDTLANALQKHLRNPNSEFPAHLYEDDIIIHVKSTLDPQQPIVMGPANTSSDGELGERLLTESRTAVEAVAQKGEDELKMAQRKTVMHSDEKPESDAHRRDTSAVRWEQPRTLVRKLDLDSFDPLFVRNVVEGSELFAEEVLSDLY